jgi:hypothetical protein
MISREQVSKRSVISSEYYKQQSHKLTKSSVAKDIQMIIEDRIENDTNQLANITNVRIRTRTCRDNLSHNHTQIDLFKPTYSEQPKCWKFITSTTDVAEPEEIVLSVQGIITHMDLPPFMKR